MKKFCAILGYAFILIICASSLAQAASVGAIEETDELISVSGEGHHRSFACNGRKLEIMGSNHVITTSGVCSQVEVSGSMNTLDVTIAPKGTLVVEGSEQTVRWRSTTKIKQDISGVDNKITRITE